MQPPAPSRAQVLDVDLSLVTHPELCRLARVWGEQRLGQYICICNVHTVMEAADNPAYAEVLNGSAVSTPDGMPLVWMLRKLGYPQQPRVYGPDFLLAYADHAARTGSKSYFYGGAPGVAKELANTLRENFPGFQSAGEESPPFRDLTPDEDAAAIERINASGADVVWIGLGAPKQEFWMAAHAGRIKPTMVGVGAAFDFLTGHVSQAPRWVMRSGLEWLYRFLAEPRRLWKRYAYHNPRFLWRAWAQLRKQRRQDT